MCLSRCSSRNNKIFSTTCKVHETAGMVSTVLPKDLLYRRVSPVKCDTMHSRDPMNRLRNICPINAPGMGRFKLFDLVAYI